MGKTYAQPDDVCISPHDIEITSKALHYDPGLHITDGIKFRRSEATRGFGVNGIFFGSEKPSWNIERFKAFVGRDIERKHDNVVDTKSMQRLNKVMSHIKVSIVREGDQKFGSAS